MLKSGFRTYPYNTQFGCTSNYFALVSAHSGDFLKVIVGWDVAGRNTSIQVEYESYFRWEAAGQRGESQETQEIQGRVSWSENLCLTCDFFVSFRTSEEQGVTSFVWQIKSYGSEAHEVTHLVKKGSVPVAPTGSGSTDAHNLVTVQLCVVRGSTDRTVHKNRRRHTFNF